MQTTSNAMSTRIKQHVVIEFLTAEKLNPTKIHRRLKAFYGHDVIDRFTANRWAVKFRDCDSDIIVEEKCSGSPITTTDDKHRKIVNNLI